MWVKLSDDWLRNKKVRAAGRDARELWLAGITYCNANDTKGFIPDYDLDLIAAEGDVKNPRALLKRLFDTRVTGNPLWHAADGGWAIHDYAEFQLPVEGKKTKEEVSQKRSEAGKKGANAKWQNGKSNSNLPENNDKSNNTLLEQEWQNNDKPSSNLLENNDKNDSKIIAPYPVSRIPGSRDPNPGNNNGVSAMANGMANHGSEVAVVVAQLKLFGISDHDASGLLTETEASIEVTIEAIRQQIEWLPHRDAKKPAVVLLKAIREGWQEPDGAKQAAQKQTRVKQTILCAEQAAAAQAAKDLHFDEVFSAMLDDDQLHINEEVERLYPIECPIQVTVSRRKGREIAGTDVLKKAIRNRLLIERGLVETDNNT